MTDDLLERISEHMRTLESRSDREGDNQPVGEFLAELLEIPWSEEFDRLLEKKVNEIPELIRGYYAERVAVNAQAVGTLGFTQGITFAVAVLEVTGQLPGLAGRGTP